MSTGRNTRIDYMYRDAGNWKQYPEMPFIVAGALTDEEIDRLRGTLVENDNFVAGQVGMDALQGQVTPGTDDHGYCEVEDITLTDDAPTYGHCTAQELLARFEAAAAEGWDPVAECERLGIPLI